jgi:thiol-disulfide isomerase/thioredoxin
MINRRKAIQMRSLIYTLLLVATLIATGCVNSDQNAGANLHQTTTLLPTSITAPTPEFVTHTFAFSELPAETNTTPTAIYFYGDGCAACASVNPIIADIQARYPELYIEVKEVNGNKNNFQKFYTMHLNEFNDTTFAIPTVYIGKNALVGELEIKDHIEEYILAEKLRIVPH